MKNRRETADKIIQTNANNLRTSITLCQAPTLIINSFFQTIFVNQAVYNQEYVPKY